MNINASSFTIPFTAWKAYQDHESSLISDAFWQTESTLAPETLNRKHKVDEALQKTKSFIQSEGFSSQIKDNICLEGLRALSLQTAVQKQLMGFKTLSIPLEKKIISLIQDVEHLSYDLDTFEVKASEIVHRISSFSLELFEIRTTLRSDRAMLTAQEITKDRRCYKKFIKEIDQASENGFLKEKIDEIFADWREKGAFLEQYTFEECWSWKGRLNAYTLQEHHMARLANILHTIACCFEALKQNLRTWEFTLEPEEDEFNPQGMELSFPLEDGCEDLMEIENLVELLMHLNKMGKK